MTDVLKILKTIDLTGQAATVILPLVSSVFQIYFWGVGIFSIAILLGGWQVLSFLLHLTQTHRLWLEKGRRTYGVFLFIVVLGGGMAWANDGFLIPYLFLLMCAGIGMAISYFLISYQELWNLRHLKSLT